MRRTSLEKFSRESGCDAVLQDLEPNRQGVLICVARSSDSAEGRSPADRSASATYEGQPEKGVLADMPFLIFLFERP